MPLIRSRQAPVITSYSIHYTKLYEVNSHSGSCLDEGFDDDSGNRIVMPLYRLLQMGKALRLATIPMQPERAAVTIRPLNLIPLLQQGLIDAAIQVAAADRERADRLTRITSYNVCYTKLLRAGPFAKNLTRTAAFHPRKKIARRRCLS